MGNLTDPIDHNAATLLGSDETLVELWDRLYPERMAAAREAIDQEMRQECAENGTPCSRRGQFDAGCRCDERKPRAR